MNDSPRKKESPLWSFMGAGLVAVAIIAGVFIGGAVTAPKPVQVPADSVATRTVVDYTVLPQKGNAEDSVLYTYVGDKVPEKLAPKEDITKRTENSYTEDLGVKNAGTPKETHGYHSVFFARPVYVQEGNDWHYRNMATSTLSAFNAAKKENFIASLFWTPVLAASISPFSGAGDGQAESSESGDTENPAAWSDCYNGGGPNQVESEDYTSTVANVVAQRKSGLGGNCDIVEAFVPFDTHTMPGNATVARTTLSLYVISKADNNNDGNDLVDIVQTNQTSNTSLANGDYFHAGTTAGATALDITAITTSAYNVWTLNATGMGWIKGSGVTSNCGATAGWTCLGGMEHHVTVNSTPATNVTGDFITFSTSENTGTSQDPSLSVTYTLGSFAFWQFQDY